MVGTNAMKYVHVATNWNRESICQFVALVLTLWHGVSAHEMQRKFP